MEGIISYMVLRSLGKHADPIAMKTAMMWVFELPLSYYFKGKVW